MSRTIRDTTDSSTSLRVALILAPFFCAMLVIGFFLGFGAADESGPLPKCAEDEALVPIVYPYTKGADLKCNDRTSIGGVKTDHGFCVIEANTEQPDGFEVVCK